MDLSQLLGEELATQVEAKLGDKKLAVINDGSWLPKSKFDEKLNEVKELRNEIAQRDEQLGQLKGAAQGNEDLLKQIADLQAQNENTQKEFSEKLRTTNLQAAIKLALNGKVQDLDIVSSLLKKDEIELDENGNIVKGLDEQVDALKESKSFLFVPSETPKVEEQPKPEVKMGIGNPKTGESGEVDVFAAALAKLNL